jgi:uroporphyrinogen decarboxylase
MEDLLHNPAAFAQKLADLFGGLDTDIVFPGSGLNSLPAEAIGGLLAFDAVKAPMLSYPIIETSEDAAFFETIDIKSSPHTTALIEMISRLRVLLPDRFLCVTSWGPFTWAMILCDWNMLREKTTSEKSFIRDICSLGVRLSSAFLEPLIARRLIDGIAIPDGAATLVPNDLYIESILPAEKELFAMAKSRGIKTLLHQCGEIQKQLGLYKETQADCISIDAGVALDQARAELGEKVVLAGNVDVINTVLGGSPELIEGAVADCVSKVRDPYQRYILMPSCDLPPETPMENVQVFLAAADLAASWYNQPQS